MTPLQVKEKLPSAPFTACCVISALQASDGRIVPLDLLDERLEELRGYPVTYPAIRSAVKTARRHIEAAGWSIEIVNERKFGYRLAKKNPAEAGSRQ